MHYQFIILVIHLLAVSFTKAEACETAFVTTKLSASDASLFLVAVVQPTEIQNIAIIAQTRLQSANLRMYLDDLFPEKLSLLKLGSHARQFRKELIENYFFQTAMGRQDFASGKQQLKHMVINFANQEPEISIDVQEGLYDEGKNTQVIIKHLSRDFSTYGDFELSFDGEFKELNSTNKI